MKTEAEAIEILAMLMQPMTIYRGGAAWRVDTKDAPVPHYGYTAQEAIESAIRWKFGTDLITVANDYMRKEAEYSKQLCERLFEDC